MNEKSTFTFSRYEYDLIEGTASFYYEVTHDAKIYTFVESLTIVSSMQKHIEWILASLHLVLGISYWKLFCPKVIKIPYRLSKEQAYFWDTLYTKGLGEFFYRNQIDYRDLVHFPYVQTEKIELPEEKFSDRLLVMLGAGKDSIVTAEFLKKEKKDFTLFTANPFFIHKEVANRIGVPLVEIKRKIDPKLVTLKGFNGHVPITAITSFLALFAASVYDFGHVIVSNEKSANFGNVNYLGSEINHQWSKSYEFETMFKNYIKTFTSISYYSYLREMTELQIVEEFIKHEKYFEVFSSCNKNFRIQGNELKGQWCGECPKCAFVFLLLAAFLSKEKVLAIFGKNLFADFNLISIYRELLGIEGFKPFECVGTPEESMQAFSMIVAKGQYKDDIVVKKLYENS